MVPDDVATRASPLAVEISVRLPPEPSVPAVTVTVPIASIALPRVRVWPLRLTVILLSERVDELVCVMYKVPIEPLPPTLMEEVDEPVMVPVPDIAPLMVSVAPFRLNTTPEETVSVAPTVVDEFMVLVLLPESVRLL